VDATLQAQRQGDRLAARLGVVRLLFIHGRPGRAVGDAVDDDHGRPRVARALAELELLGTRARRARDQRQRRERPHHPFAMVPSNSASQTTCPSTLASPRIFQTAPPFRSGTTSRTSWSPGTTGLRNFTLSMAMK